MKVWVLFGDGDVAALNEEAPGHVEDGQGEQHCAENFLGELLVGLVEAIRMLHLWDP